MGFVLALGGCAGGGGDGASGPPGTPGPDGAASLFAVIAEPAGTNCANAGSRITAGLDSNRNGLLDASEVTQSRYACNGTNGSGGSAMLVKTAVEPAGAQCATGGFSIRVGIDANANNVLEASEVSSADYACNGLAGQNGTNGLSSLVTTGSEAAGANCAHGGTRFSAGLDINANTILEPAEVTSSSYACNGSPGSNGNNGTNGTNGTNGANGLNSLIRLSAEPAGANCAAGGTKIEAGLDSNRNNALEPTEIDNTSYVCVAVRAPLTPANLSVSYAVKSYAFAWDASVSATHYELAEDPDGAGVQTELQIGASIPATNYTHSLATQLLHQRLNAQYRVRACNSGGCSAYSPAITPNLTQAIGYFKASNTGVNDSFGQSVALSDDGNTLAVGAQGESSGAIGIGGDQSDNSASFAGAVYVFTRSAANTWSQQAYVKASNTESLDLFGHSVALSADGNTLAVGAVGEASNAAGIGGDQTNNSLVRAGAVYMFTRSASTWTQQAYVKASNPDANDFFGMSVALSDDGNSLAVGARESSNATGIGGGQTDNSALDAGAVYVFVRSASTWSQQEYVKASNTGAGDNFGFALALSSDGNTLAVGAFAEAGGAIGIGGLQTDNSAFTAGAVYVFTRSASTWSQQAYIKASNTQADDSFGRSVALSADGNTLAVGAYFEDSSAIGVGNSQTDNSAAQAGAVYVFTRSASTWSQQAYVKASNTGANDNFGYSVALSADGNTLATGAFGEASNASGIGALQTDNSATRAGAVYVFTRSASTWSQQAYVKASNAGANDNFGWAVALSADGNTLATAGNLEDSGATGINGNQGDNTVGNSGSVYIY